MSPEERLDALLSAPWRPGQEQREGGGRTDPVGTLPDENAELAPLLAAARRLQALGEVEPDPHFAEALHMRLLARAAERRREAQRVTMPWGGVSQGRRTRHLGPPLPQRVPLRLGFVAALVLLILGVGTITLAAAAASPGSPLFGLHLAEQAIQVAAARDNAQKARLRLQYARQSLASVRDAATQHQDAIYQSALQTLRDDESAAASAIAAVSAGSSRQALDADLDQLRTDERATLLAALASLNWTERIMTTQTLDGLGVAVLHITGVTMDTEEGAWHITIIGTGFQPGAVLLVNGQPAGGRAVTSAAEFDAHLPPKQLTGMPTTLGVGNPDGTAAVSGAIQVLTTPAPDGHSDQSTPDPGNGHSKATVTPSADGRKGTPTPGDLSGASGN